MADWAVLGLAGDPVPGDPVEVRAVASRLGGYALTARVNTDRLRAVASDVSGGPLQARGDFAAVYARQIGELPELLGRLGRAYQGCSDALGRFTGPLEDARGRSRAALRRGGDAFDRFTGARRQADALMPAGKVLPWQSGPVGVAGLCVSITVAQADMATTGMDEGARTQVRAAVTRAIAAAADQRTARRLADEAAALRDGAAARCAEEIDGALDGSGIKNKSFWQKAWDTVSAPFRSWDAFVDFCGKVAMVAGVIALFVSGPLGWALMAAALVAGAVILADTLNRYAHGQAGLLDVGLAILGVIPGGRGVLSVTKMARAARGLVPALLRGGGRVLRGGASGFRTMAGSFGSARRIPGPMTVKRFTGKPMLEKYRYETLAGDSRNPFHEIGGAVRRLTDQEREGYRVFVDNDGLLRNARDGSLADTADAATLHTRGGGRAIFVMDEQGNLYASNYQHLGEFHHSSLANGQPVAAAGEIAVSDGVIQHVTAGSGHYQPGVREMGQFVDEMGRLGISDIPVFDFSGRVRIL